jgi:hypothetical protein
MTARAIRWFLILAPVLAGVVLLIVGSAESVSTAFGIVLIGIGPIIWMWNWFIRMSFDEEREKAERRENAARTRESERTREPETRVPETPPREQHIEPELRHREPAPHRHDRDLGRSRRRPQ